ncbi:MAG: TonB-dependent receptor, partial [Bacteroidota bacterium]
PKISLNYKWTDHQMTYLSVTRGYKSGGFNTTFEREEDRSFDPEFSWNYETGWKASFGDRANLRMALFYIDWEDLQVYQPIPSGRGSMLKNAASAYSRGAELEVHLLPLDNLRVSGNAGYADVRFRDFTPDPDESLDYDGNKVPYVPDLTGFLSATYRIPLDGALFHDLCFSVNWRETGKIYWNDANEYSQQAYGLMGANISCGISDFTLRFWSENLLNTEYRSFQFTAIGNVYAQPGRPLRFGLTLSYAL